MICALLAVGLWALLGGPALHSAREIHGECGRHAPVAALESKAKRAADMPEASMDARKIMLLRNVEDALVPGHNWRGRCPACDRRLEGIESCVHHLGSREHLLRFGGPCRCGKCRGLNRPEFNRLFASMFARELSIPRRPAANNASFGAARQRAALLMTCEAQRAAHEAAGFDLPAIDSALKRGPPKRVEPRGFREAVQEVEPLSNWHREEARFCVRWDFGESGVRAGRRVSGEPTVLTVPPPMNACLSRLTLDTPPPVTIPALPAALVEAQESVQELTWPYSPGASLALAATRLRGESLRGVHAVAGPSLLYALAGKGDARSSFLVQRVGGVTCFQSIPARRHNAVGMVGHQVEELLCSPRAASQTYYSIGRVAIEPAQRGGAPLRLLLAAEVDGSIAGEPVEVKSFTGTAATRSHSGTRRLREMLQLLASGSKRLLAAGLSRDRSQVVEIREKTLSGEIYSSEAWSRVGQRIRYLLPRILDDPRVIGAVERPVHLVFDHSKLPVLKVAPPGCGVVDPAWQALFGGDDGDVE